MTDEKIVEYELDEGDHHSAYVALLKTIYSGFNHSNAFVGTKARLKLPDNPFFTLGNITNFIAYSGSMPVGHISAIEDPRLIGPNGEKIGLVGFYECVDDVELSRQLIGTALRRLESRSCAVVRGPIDLTTWNSYRFALDQNPQAAFFLEPLTQPFYPGQFEDTGFSEARRYASLQRQDLSTILEYTKRVGDPLKERGFQIRRVTPNNFLDSRRAIYDMSVGIFDGNWSFVPISFDEFSYLYGEDPKTASQTIIELLSDSSDQTIGFSFAVPDLLTDSLVIKSIGVLPEKRHTWGGVLLGQSLIEHAQDLGLNSVIYALRRREKITKNPIYNGSTVTREYTAYEKKLNS